MFVHGYLVSETKRQLLRFSQFQQVSNVKTNLHLFMFISTQQCNHTIITNDRPYVSLRRETRIFRPLVKIEVQFFLSRFSTSLSIYSVIFWSVGQASSWLRITKKMNTFTFLLICLLNTFIINFLGSLHFFMKIF